MSLDWKKIFIMALFIASVGAFAFFLYYFFYLPLFGKPETPAANVGNANGNLPLTVNINGRLFMTNGSGLPGAGAEINLNPTANPIEDGSRPSATANGGLTQTDSLTDKAASFSAANGNGIVYYNPANQKFEMVSAAGQITTLSDKAFFNVQNVVWSGDRNQAILEYPDGAKIMYDFKTDTQVTLPKHWQDFSFSPKGPEIAFKSIGMDPENRFLAVAKSDGTAIKILEDIGGAEDKFQVSWSPNNQMVSFVNEGKDLNRSEIYFVGFNKENFKSMIVPGRGFSGQWSPEGDKIVYSVYNSDSDYKPQLWISDATADTVGANRRAINLETWSDKCSFGGSDKIYCAVPTNLPEGAALDRSQANGVNDQIYEIDLTTGVKKLLAIPSGNHTIRQIILTDDPNSLFFSDQNNGRIYRINL